MKRVYIYFFLAFMACSCNKAEVELPILSETHSTSINGSIRSFSSKEELYKAVCSNTADILRTKSTDIADNLFAQLPATLISTDPVLSIDACRDYIDGLVCTAYDVCGYDVLVPNKDFARLLNCHGEVKVDNVVYKVSPRGTYYFTPDYLQMFESNYGLFDGATPTEIGEGHYCFDSVVIDGRKMNGIHIFDTFETGCDKVERSSDAVMPMTKGSTYYPANEFEEMWMEAQSCINWGQQDKYYTDAQTEAGEFLQGIFGRNQSYYTNFSDERRLRAKLFYYNYVVYSEIGGVANMEKKGFLGWADEKAERVYLIWNNIVMFAPFYKTIKYPSSGNGVTQRYFLGENVEKIPGRGDEGRVMYFAGAPLSKSELRNLANTDYLSSVISQYTDGRIQSMNSIKGAKYITEDGIYFVVYPYGQMKENVSEIRMPFNSDFHFEVGVSYNMSAPPTTVSGWLNSVKAQTVKSPELIQGEIRAAAKYNGVFKGMRLIKEYKEKK